MYVWLTQWFEHKQKATNISEQPDTRAFYAWPPECFVSCGILGICPLHAGIALNSCPRHGNWATDVAEFNSCVMIGMQQLWRPTVCLFRVAFRLSCFTLIYFNFRNHWHSSNCVISLFQQRTKSLIVCFLLLCGLQCRLHTRCNWVAAKFGQLAIWKGCNNEWRLHVVYGVDLCCGRL